MVSTTRLAAGEPNQSRRLVAWIKNPSRWDSFFAFFERVWFVSSYARIYGYFKRQLARVSVRAAMLVRLRALDVVLGRSPRPESSTDRKEAKRAKATRLAAVHVVSESGIPADRGSFGA